MCNRARILLFNSALSEVTGKNLFAIQASVWEIFSFFYYGRAGWNLGTGLNNNFDFLSNFSSAYILFNVSAE